MKKFTYYIFFIFILLIIIPFIILRFIDTPISNKENDSESVKEHIIDIKEISVYLHESNQLVQMNLEEYVKGVVAAEMPASFEIEALKAQAVAARTYTLYKINNIDEDGKKYHKSADICTNYAHCQAWNGNEKLKDMWGLFGYFKYFDKISKAVDDTSGNIIVYGDELINPLFHSTSGGKTENSEDVFVTMLPYLRSVESLGEEVSPKFKDSVVISFNDFKAKLDQNANGIVLNKQNLANLNAVSLSEGGRIKKIQIGNKIFTGTEIRSIFNLNSTNFTITLDNDNVIINTVGYGHGVGMSQFGANHLAKEGKNYENIIKHYYKGINIINIKDY